MSSHFQIIPYLLDGSPYCASGASLSVPGWRMDPDDGDGWRDYGEWG
jgi:hypothetical protein